MHPFRLSVSYRRQTRSLMALVALSAVWTTSHAQDSVSFHEALSNEWIEVEVLSFSQEQLTLGLKTKSAEGAKRIKVETGTWIELNGTRPAGRLYLQSDAVVDLERKPNGWFATARAYANPLSANVPIFEREPVRRSIPERQVLKAGIEPIAAKILDGNRFTGKEGILGRTAGILMMERPNLSAAEFRTFADRYLNQRRTESQEADVKGKKRSASLWIWTPTEEHFKIGQHLVEKARAASAGGEMSGGATVADAFKEGLITAEARKGISGNMIIRLTRTPKASDGSMSVSFPRGTFILFDDKGDGQPVKLYPIQDTPLDLFGEVQDGAHIPCLNGSYKRRIKTTRVLKIDVGFDARVATLFHDRKEDEFLQMAVEAVLLDHPDLTRDQLQYHITQVRVPKIENVAVTDALIDAAKRRIAGDASGVAVTAPPQTQSQSRVRSMPTAPPKAPAKQDDPNRYGLTLSAGVKGVRIDPEVPVDPTGVLTKDPSGKAIWKKMVQYVPEYPENELQGTWISVPEAEARQYVLWLRLDAMDALAAAGGGALPADAARALEAKAQLDQKLTHYYIGSLSFSQTGDVGGALKGPNDSSPTPVRAKWRFDGIQTVQLAPSTEIKKLVFSREKRLVFHDERSGRLVVLRKQ